VAVVGVPRAAAQVRAARATWQGGRCVEVQIVEGQAGGALRPGTVARIVPALRSRVDGARVAPFQMRGDSPAAGFGSTREWQRPYVMPYVLTLAPDERATVVELRAASRRGRAELRLPFTQATIGADSGMMTYTSEARYTLAYRNARNTERLDGQALATERVRSRLRLVFDRFENEDMYYRVEAVHDFAMKATAGATASAQTHAGAYVGRLTATLDGTGTAHNPRGAKDTPIVQGRYVAPYLGTPSQNVGTLRLYKDGGRDRYELSIRTGQIAPALDIKKHRQGPCPVNAIWKVVEHYSNATHTETRDVDDPNRCTNVRTDTTTFGSPLTYGAISVDRGQHRFVTGTFDPSKGGWSTLTGHISGQTTSCEVARAYDPLQIASVLTTNDVSFSRGGWSLEEHGTCSFIYTLEWRLEVPPPYRQP
jgi:hypothetical protein